MLSREWWIPTVLEIGLVLNKLPVSIYSNSGEKKLTKPSRVKAWWLMVAEILIIFGSSNYLFDAIPAPVPMLANCQLDKVQRNLIQNTINTFNKLRLKMLSAI